MEKQKKNYDKKETFNQKTFTHFISIPLIETKIKSRFQELQDKIFNVFNESEKMCLALNNPNLFHITLSMLCLSKKEHHDAALEIFNKNETFIKEILGKTKFFLKLGKVLCFDKPKIPGKAKKYNSFSKKKEENNIVYVEVLENDSLKKLMQITHILIKEFLDKEIMDTNDLKPMKVLYDHNLGLFRAEKYHITLFRVQGDVDLEKALKIFEDFEFGEVECNSLDVSTRFEYDDDKFYQPFFRIFF